MVAARLLGTDRHPSNGKRTQDIDHEVFYIEHKTRKAVPEYFSLAWKQLSSCPPGKIPLMILAHARGTGHKTQQYVVLRLEDFVAMLEVGDGTSVDGEGSGPDPG